MGSEFGPAGDGEEELSTQWAASLLAQLHYDRADVARLSQAAARAMDVAISLVQQAVGDRWAVATDDPGQPENSR